MTAILPMPRRAVLADVGPLYAALDPDDQFHLRFQREIDRLKYEGINVVVIYPMLFEAYTLAVRRLGLRVALPWLAQVRTNGFLLNPAADDYGPALLRPDRYVDQPISLFDALLALTSDRYGIPIWTYDHHFDVMGARVWR